MAYVGLDRGIVDHWIYQDAEYFKVWFEILLRTRYSKEPEKKMQDGKFFTIEYGQFMYGRVSWSERLGVSEQRLRTLFKKLIKDNMIELISTYPKFSIYTVNNYAKFNHQLNHQQTQTEQGFHDDANQQINSVSTSNQPAANQQLTTQEEGSKKVNKVKKVKEEVIKTLYGEHVLLSDEQYIKLINDLTEPDVTKLIDDINYWFTQKPLRIKDYKDHNLMIRKWHKNNLEKKLIVLKGGQADVAATESRGKPNFSQYPASNQQTPKAAGQSESIRRGAGLNSEYDLDQFIRG